MDEFVNERLISFVCIVFVYGTASGISFEQKRVNNKTNEIPVFQEMLNCLNVKGKIITADAMHCQEETCRKIVKNGEYYVFGLKGNQRCTYEEAKLLKIRDISLLGEKWSGSPYFR